MIPITKALAFHSMTQKITIGTAVFHTGASVSKGEIVTQVPVYSGEDPTSNKVYERAREHLRLIPSENMTPGLGSCKLTFYPTQTQDKP